MFARTAAAALALAGVGVLSARAEACTKTWDAASGSWTSATSWTPAGVPGPSDDVCLSAAGSYTVTVPAIAGGVQVRSLTVGGGTGSQTLEIVGQSVPDAGVTQHGSSLNAANGGTIASNGEIVLDATDGGTTATPGETAGGSATLAGGAFTNNGVILALSESAMQLRDHLRVPLTNAAGGTVQVAGGFLDYDNGTTFQNDGTLRVDGASYFLVRTDPLLSATPSQLTNAGSVVASGGVNVEGATWTQAGGSVTGDIVRIANGALDYRSGTGSFILSEQFGPTPGRLSGTIPAGQTVTVSGGSFGWPDLSGWIVQLAGDQVVNRGTLVFESGDDDQAVKGGPAVVQGSPLLNYGTISARGGRYGDSTTYPVYLRSNVTNMAGGSINVQGVVMQDSGNAVVNDGTVQLDGRYVLSTSSVATGSSTFANPPDGTISLSIFASSPGRFEVGDGSTLNAGGTLLPTLAVGYRAAQGQVFAALPITGGRIAGRFATVGGGFSADYSHTAFIGVRYGARVGPVQGGRGMLTVPLACPAGGATCPKLVVRLTAVERAKVRVGKGTHRRTHLRVRTVAIASGGVTLAAGRERTLTLRLNALGRRLLARSAGRLAATVVVLAGGRTLATTRVRVRRL